MTPAAGRRVGLTLAALATVAALCGCESRATPAQIRREARSQATLSTGPAGPTGAAAPIPTIPPTGGGRARPVDRRRGRRGHRATPDGAPRPPDQR